MIDTWPADWPARPQALGGNPRLVRTFTGKGKRQRIFWEEETRTVARFEIEGLGTAFVSCSYKLEATRLLAVFDAYLGGFYLNRSGSGTKEEAALKARAEYGTEAGRASFFRVVNSWAQEIRDEANPPYGIVKAFGPYEAFEVIP